MRIVEVMDIDSGTRTRVGITPDRSPCAERLRDFIIEEDLYRHVEIEIYDGEFTSEPDENEVERAHELGRLLSLRMGWA